MGTIQGVWATQWFTGYWGYGAYGQSPTAMGNGAIDRGMGYNMGHIGNEIHGQWGTGVWTTWVMGPMGNLLPKYQKDAKKMSSQKDGQKMKHLD